MIHLVRIHLVRQISGTKVRTKLNWLYLFLFFYGYNHFYRKTYLYQSLIRLCLYYIFSLEIFAFSNVVFSGWHLSSISRSCQCCKHSPNPICRSWIFGGRVKSFGKRFGRYPTTQNVKWMEYYCRSSSQLPYIRWYVLTTILHSDIILC